MDTCHIGRQISVNYRTNEIVENVEYRAMLVPVEQSSQRDVRHLDVVSALGVSSANKFSSSSWAIFDRPINDEAAAMYLSSRLRVTGRTSKRPRSKWHRASTDFQFYNRLGRQTIIISLPFSNQHR
ncbi:unnamed protein product [Lasius platythorax]|uniref:Uncharacterized protein n=1 Tax=Lasius platythorax TaxID=488582 RepID=A0AAV2NDP0_9HYME